MTSEYANIVQDSPSVDGGIDFLPSDVINIYHVTVGLLFGDYDSIRGRSKKMREMDECLNKFLDHFRMSHVDILSLS